MLDCRSAIRNLDFLPSSPFARIVAIPRCRWIRHVSIYVAKFSFVVSPPCLTRGICCLFTTCFCTSAGSRETSPVCLLLRKFFLPVFSDSFPRWKLIQRSLFFWDLLFRPCKGRNVSFNSFSRIGYRNTFFVCLVVEDRSLRELGQWTLTLLNGEGAKKFHHHPRHLFLFRFGFRLPYRPSVLRRLTSSSFAWVTIISSPLIFPRLSSFVATRFSPAS